MVAHVQIQVRMLSNVHAHLAILELCVKQVCRVFQINDATYQGIVWNRNWVQSRNFCSIVHICRQIEGTAPPTTFFSFAPDHCSFIFLQKSTCAHQTPAYTEPCAQTEESIFIARVQLDIQEKLAIQVRTLLQFNWLYSLHSFEKLCL